MSEKIVLILYLLFVVAGFGLAYLYGRRTKEFVFREYLAMISMPVAGIIGIVYFLGPIPLLVFAVSCFLGPLLEWLLGFTYHAILGSRLWVYERMPLPKRYSSWLTIPFWGSGLTFIYLFFKVLF